MASKTGPRDNFIMKKTAIQIRTIVRVQDSNLAYHKEIAVDQLRTSTEREQHNQVLFYVDDANLLREKLSQIFWLIPICGLLL